MLFILLINANLGYMVGATPTSGYVLIVASVSTAEQTGSSYLLIQTIQLELLFTVMSQLKKSVFSST